MKLLKTLATIFCLIALCAFVVPTATADDWNRETVVTFSGPVEVPGVGAQILPAGTYVFKIFDSLSDRHIVQIFSQDKTHVFTTILAIPNYRLHATDKTVITFRERPAGQPEALRAWFYPGREWGDVHASTASCRIFPAVTLWSERLDLCGSSFLPLPSRKTSHPWSCRRHTCRC